MAIKRICPKCGEYHAIGVKCYKGAVAKDTAANKFRQMYAWRKKAEAIKERDNYMCEYCKEQGHISFRGLSVHHITPINEDYDRRLDDENLITLCVDCHTKAENGEISKKELYDITRGIYEKR